MQQFSADYLIATRLWTNLDAAQQAEFLEHPRRGPLRLQRIWNRLPEQERAEVRRRFVARTQRLENAVDTLTP